MRLGCGYYKPFSFLSEEWLILIGGAPNCFSQAKKEREFEKQGTSRIMIRNGPRFVNNRFSKRTTMTSWSGLFRNGSRFVNSKNSTAPHSTATHTHTHTHKGDTCFSYMHFLSITDLKHFQNHHG